MILRTILLALAAMAACSAIASADEIWAVGRERPHLGVIRSVTRNGVTIEANALQTRVDVAEIRWVSYDQDPSELKLLRVRIRQQGNYKAALDQLDRQKLEDLPRPESRAELEFYRALCRAKVALAGGSPIADAGRDLLAFLGKYPQTYHYFEANELLGDLLRADGKHSGALEAYRRLGEYAPFQLRSQIAIGWTLLEQNKAAEALAAFDTVLNTAGNTPEIERQKKSAQIGKAAALAETDPPAAIKMVEAALDPAVTPPEDFQLNPRLYNVLGHCYEKANRPKDAILAYLHVDILYPRDPDEHARALSNLVKLWSQVNQAERSRETRDRLRSTYPGSRWAQ